ncbi:MAG: [FeFe] hydrogenase H-cluster radical SAM maturase HydG [bacterium]
MQHTLSAGAENFIDLDKLQHLLDAAPASPDRIREIIAKALEKQPLAVAETAALLNAGPALTEEIFEAARQLKRNVYGNRIVLFAPVYIGNKCINDCAYCAFRSGNTEAVRRTLTPDEIQAQIARLEDQGHKRLILVFGEHADYNASFIADSVRQVYAVKKGHGEIRRVNINAAPLSVADFRIVKASGIGTYQIFQETYHEPTYRRMHPAGTAKADFRWRLDGLSRAFEGGIDDMGIGALFGLYDWRFEVLGLVSHALYLQRRHGVGPHTISFPRLRPAQNAKFDHAHQVDDDAFKKIVAVLRLAVPYTGLICTARETPAVRRAVMSFGVSQIDAGSRVEIGGYTEIADKTRQYQEREQFELGDLRPLDEVIRELLTDGYIPSFCTACYRLGRTGEHFMEFAIPGFIKRFCTPNALLTLQEYLNDYATPETRAAGEALIDRETAAISDPGQKRTFEAHLAKIRAGTARDLHF